MSSYSADREAARQRLLGLVDRQRAEAMAGAAARAKYANQQSARQYQQQQSNWLGPTAQGALTGFMVSGGNPIGAAVGAGAGYLMKDQLNQDPTIGPMAMAGAGAYRGYMNRTSPNEVSNNVTNNSINTAVGAAPAATPPVDTVEPFRFRRPYDVGEGLIPR